MPGARSRFGSDYNEALRSFIVPILFFPLTLLIVYAYPSPGLKEASANTVALLYSLRMAICWGLFLGAVYFLTCEIGKKEHFCQFVIASNWLAVPASVIFMPVMWCVMTGTHTWEELYPFTLCLMFYSYGFTAYMAAWILRIPMELAGFIAVIAFIINDYSIDVLDSLSTVL